MEKKFWSGTPRMFIPDPQHWFPQTQKNGRSKQLFSLNSVVVRTDPVVEVAGTGPENQADSLALWPACSCCALPPHCCIFASGESHFLGSKGCRRISVACGFPKWIKISKHYWKWKTNNLYRSGTYPPIYQAIGRPICSFFNRDTNFSRIPLDQ
jgi:hypothetical protein